MLVEEYIIFQYFVQSFIESVANFLKKFKKLPQRIIVSDPNTKPKFLELIYIFSQQNGLAIGMLPKISEISR